jgi:hypothetical protein
MIRPQTPQAGDFSILKPSEGTAGSTSKGLKSGVLGLDERIEQQLAIDSG